MNVEEVLADIAEELRAIKSMLSAPTRTEALARSSYSILQVAELTEEFGIRTYAAYTIRKACLDGRIPEAEKLDDGKTWSIPRAALERILEQGIPPERRGQTTRSHSSHVSQENSR